MEDIMKLFDDVIKEDVEKIATLDVGSEERTTAIDNLAKIHKMRIEEIKAETERKEETYHCDLDYLKRKDDARHKNAQLALEIASVVLNIGLQVGLTVGGWKWYDTWHRRGLKFQEYGTVTDPETRNLISRMLPRIKNF